MKIHCLLAAFLSSLLLFSCSERTTDSGKDSIALVGADIIDGKGGEPIRGGVLLIRHGRIVSVGSVNQIRIPADADIVNVSSKTIIPGIINTHGHVGDVKGIEPGHYSPGNILDQLALYARYGVTTVVSLGGDRPDAEPIRAVVDTSAAPGHARLYVAGTVITGETPGEAIAMVDNNFDMGVDLMKIRVDDNLGSTAKMPEVVYKAVIKRSHELDLPLAAHLYYLDDAKSLIRSGADFIAHSVRDQQVDAALIHLLKERNVCYCPTLTRELSTFVYEEVPDFFNDPFFLREVDTSILRKLKDTQYQLQVKSSRSAQTYKRSLETALENLKILSDSGVTLAFGTDSGVAGRFQGYFEHLEMKMMSDAGLTPMEILLSATGNAARCLNLKDVGTLEANKYADFIVLDDDPLADISNTRSISAVWIGGREIQR